MVTHVSSLTFCGIHITEVDVQVQISPGIPAFTIVGLPDKTIAESKERVKAAITSLGLALPAKKILVNLAPADLVKEGSHFDLAIACAILAEMGLIPASDLQEYMIMGELSLDGSVLGVAGALPAAIGANAHQKGLICPEKNGKEAAWSGNNILAPSNLLSLINHFKGVHALIPPQPEKHEMATTYTDLSDIAGQERAKRALEITAAGRHNMLMFGPPGTGKSMLAQRLPGILPSMTIEEIIECSTIASLAGTIIDGQLTSKRPFRAPHHSCSLAAMVGGGVGKRVKPGEISLAHNGVLFLDELPEFAPTVIEALRQPVEAGEILISRANAHIKYPASFQLIAAMNPCKCGYLNDGDKSCFKAPRCGSDYRMRISGPMFDRFDIHIEVGSLEDYWVNQPKNNPITSKDVAMRVQKARELQKQRYQGYGIKTNSQLYGNLLVDHAIPDSKGLELLNNAANKFKISVRSYNKILKLARTIADLAESKSVNELHIAEALSYRDSNYQKFTGLREN